MIGSAGGYQCLCSVPNPLVGATDANSCHACGRPVNAERIVSESKRPISFEDIPKVLLLATSSILEVFESADASRLRDILGEGKQGSDWRGEAVALLMAALTASLPPCPAVW